MNAIPVRVYRKPKHEQHVEWDIDHTRINNLQIILKTAERCNINCSYCYYFHGGDRSFENRPPTITDDVSDSVGKFLVNGALDLGVRNVQVVFHGGEPLMQSKRRFDRLCTNLKSSFSETGISLDLSIQTNGTLIDTDWCELFSKHGISIGISLDGPEEINDIYRVDHKGRSTYAATAQGIRCVQDYEATHGVSFGLGALTVINPNYDYRAIYKHLTETLGFRRIGFLLPDCSHDSFPEIGASAARFGEILGEIFDAWTDNPVAEVTNISRTLDFFRKGTGPGQNSGASIARHPSDSEKTSTLGNQIIVIHSDGMLSVDDSLIPASAWRNRLEGANITTTSMRDWLRSPFYSTLHHHMRNLPGACHDCSWQRICHGGDMENRFSIADGFSRKSVFCEGLATYHEKLSSYLLAHGYPKDLMMKKLGFESLEN